MAADEQVRSAYGACAAEYVSVLGSVENMREKDRQCIERWAEGIDGPVLDAGCGPGHWTALLHRNGVDIQGIDLVPEFIDSARTRFPDVPFRVASLRDFGVSENSLHGVLAWYSLIHVPPDELPGILAETARVLVPGGRLLLGFFDGPAAAPFEHAVTTAYFWSVARMRRLLRGAGFTVFDVETRTDPGARPHAAISAGRLERL